MRLLLQRVTEASVTIQGERISAIGPGLLVLVGIGPQDGEAQVQYLAQKAVSLRIFSDEEGKMNRSLLESGGQMLAVSQFTLYGNCKKGRRPSFVGAAAPEQANRLYEAFLSQVERLGVPVQAGRFGAEMQVALVNDGPVTLWLDSDELMPRA